MEDLPIIKTRKINTQKLFDFIIPILLVIVFSCRLFCYETQITRIHELNSPLFSKPLQGFTMISIWLNYATLIMLMLKPFFNVKHVDILTKYVATPVLLMNLGFIYPTVSLFLGGFKVGLLFFLLIIEIILGLAISINHLVCNFKKHDVFKTVLFALLMFLLMMVASMPNYTMQFFFGGVTRTIKIKDITAAHRMYIYGSIALPFLIYFLLRNKSEDVINYTLTYIMIAVLVGFLVNYDYTNLKEPWTWPFHLCNTALFILPLCMIFKLKKLFYFTYFINVFGALMAMLMPNYNDSVNVISQEMFRFWYNHYIAFFMPLLLVALKRFKRPTIKEFSWSMIWFFGYFMLVLGLNVVFTALGHEVDYFFINSDFIVDKLGSWATQIFNKTVTLNIFNLNLEFHLIYQILFFIVYVLLGLAIWFIYAEFFRIADSHYELHLKLKELKQIEFAASQVPGKLRKEEIMNKDIEAKLSLNHFSKKYATSKKYAVKDASFEVHAGEIFGFLGPNGAGKSTIIKSIVGIQPITEGSIEICGYDVQANPVLAKYNIGYVPDHYALYEKLTGREYINYIADIFEVPQKERDERIAKYVKIFELEASIDSKIRTYSHGMKQKITIISALVHNPKVWILDEPLTGLDPNSIFQVKECMRQHAAEGNIVFFSSHLIDIVEKLCGRIAIIKHGKIQTVQNIEDIEKASTLEEFYLSIIGNNEEDN